MFHIIFYEDAHGHSDVVDYINQLSEKTDKFNRIKLHKIVAYFDALEKMGTRIGQPFTKHLSGEIWELRPLKDRFLYAYYKDNCFIILHHFEKKTAKTPQNELAHAKRNLSDYLRRYPK